MKKSELKELIREEISNTLHENEQKCYVVLGTNNRVYGVYTDSELAKEAKTDAETTLGFEGSSARVNIITTILNK